MLRELTLEASLLMSLIFPARVFRPQMAPFRGFRNWAGRWLVCPRAVRSDYAGKLPASAWSGAAVCRVGFARFEAEIA